MSIEHTSGELTVRESSSSRNYYSVNIGNDPIQTPDNWLFSIQHNGLWSQEVQRENMRRFVACWNACNGISTDALRETVRNPLVPVILISTEALTQRAMLNALSDEAKLHGIDPTVIQQHETEISVMIQKMIVASRNN